MLINGDSIPLHLISIALCSGEVDGISIFTPGMPTHISIIAIAPQYGLATAAEGTFTCTATMPDVTLEDPSLLQEGYSKGGPWNAGWKDDP